MDLGLKGKVALVAGASQGIGKAIAVAMAEEGARVSICARGEAKLQETAESIRKKGGEVLPVVADMTVADDIQRFVSQTAARFGRLDIVVTNAGGPPPGDFMQFTDADWEGAFRLTFMSALRLAREAIPHLRSAGGGRIINISSFAAREPVAGLVLSNALRNGVVGWAKTISRELARDRILVNNVCPGRIDTERHQKLNEDRARRSNRPLEEIHRETHAEIPLRRYGAPEEVASLVAFLASEQAAYITGTTIQIDGGLIRGLP